MGHISCLPRVTELRFVFFKWVKGEQSAQDLMRKVGKESYVSICGDSMHCGTVAASRRYMHTSDGWQEWWLLMLPAQQHQDKAVGIYELEDKADAEFKRLSRLAEEGKLL